MFLARWKGNLQTPAKHNMPWHDSGHGTCLVHRDQRSDASLDANPDARPGAGLCAHVYGVAAVLGTIMKMRSG